MTTTRAPRVGATRVLHPAGLLDVTSPRVTDHAGHMVEVVQPYGCPKNGTMGMCYVDCLSCTAADGLHRVFIGLVNLSSLVS